MLNVSKITTPLEVVMPPPVITYNVYGIEKELAELLIAISRNTGGISDARYGMERLGKGLCARMGIPWEAVNTYDIMPEDTFVSGIRA